MSVVIIGGNDRMTRLYEDTCRSYGCKAKVFIHLKSEFRRKIGTPDLVILFTSTVSHKMVKCALNDIKGKKTTVARSHSSSAVALKNILTEHIHKS